MVKITKETEGNRTIKMLIYGPSGVGKTVFGSTAPDVLFIDAEAGMLSVKDKQLDKVKVETFKDILDTFEFLKAGQHSYKTVVIDSLTEVQKKSMDLIMTGSQYDRPTMADWGKNIEQIRNMVRAFRDLNMNVIFIALDHADKDEVTGTFMRGLSLQGKSLPSEVMGFVDIVGYMIAEERVKEDKSKEIIRAIRVQPGSNVYAKDRSNKLGVWVKPDFAEIYATVFGNGGAKIETPKPEAQAEAVPATPTENVSAPETKKRKKFK